MTRSWHPTLYKLCINFVSKLIKSWQLHNYGSTTKDQQFNIVLILYQFFIKVDTQLSWYRVGAYMIQSWHTTLYQLCINSVSKLMPSWHRVYTKLMHTWCQVDTELLQSWNTALYQLCISSEWTPYQSWYKVATQLCSNKVDAKMIQNWHTTLCQLFINSVSTLLWVCIYFVSSLHQHLIKLVSTKYSD